MYCPVIATREEAEKCIGRKFRTANGLTGTIHRWNSTYSSPAGHWWVFSCDDLPPYTNVCVAASTRVEFTGTAVEWLENDQDARNLLVYHARLIGDKSAHL